MVSACVLWPCSSRQKGLFFSHKTHARPRVSSYYYTFALHRSNVQYPPPQLRSSVTKRFGSGES
jgi:hypothetical protein